MAETKPKAGDDTKKAEVSAVPQVGDLRSPTTEQADAMTTFLQDNWDSAIS